MSATVEDVFSSVSTKALEDWAMMMIEPATRCADQFQADQPTFIGSMQFNGVMTGSIAVLCQESFLQALCANVLGLEDPSEVNEKMCTDALQELVNVLSGHFLTEAYGPDTVFELVFPQVVKLAGDADIRRFFENKAVHCLLADDQPVAIAIERGPINAN